MNNNPNKSNNDANWSNGELWEELEQYGADGEMSDDGPIDVDWSANTKNTKNTEKTSEFDFQPPVVSEPQPIMERDFQPPAIRQPDYAEIAKTQSEEEADLQRHLEDMDNGKTNEPKLRKSRAKWGPYAESMRKKEHQHERDLMILTEVIPYDNNDKNATSEMKNKGYTALLNDILGKFPREPKETDSAYRERLKKLVESGALSGGEHAESEEDSVVARARKYNEEHAGDIYNAWQDNQEIPNVQDDGSDKKKQELEDEEKKRLEVEEREKMLQRRKEIEEELARKKEELKELQDQDEKEKKAEAEKPEKSENEKKLEKLKEELDNILPELAEYYARNRRLFVGNKNRVKFEKLKEEYESKLGEYLKIKAEMSYEKGQEHISQTYDELYVEKGREIRAATAEAGAANKSPEEVAELRKKLMEEANAQLGAEYQKLTKELKDRITEDFLKDFIAEQSRLEQETIDKLDNGSACRKFVSKVMNNKAVKGILIAAGVTGLAVTGVGLATGALAVGIGYTAGGVALGAGKGALMGGLMSRQDSKNSAVRGFLTEEEIRRQIGEIDPTAQNKDVANVTNWLMQRYSEANQIDAASNKKRTAVSAGLSALIGGVMSGIHIGSVTKTEVTQQEITGYEPTETHSNIENISHAKGRGIDKLFEELGGDPEKFYSSGAYDTYVEVGKRYGLEVWHPGWTYPGNINSAEWTDVARSVAREAADEWARQGQVSAIQTGGEPIYGPVTRAVEQTVPNMFMNFIFKASGILTGSAIHGPALASMDNSSPEAGSPRLTRAGSARSLPSDYPEFKIPETPTGASGNTGNVTPAQTGDVAPADFGDVLPAPDADIEVDTTATKDYEPYHDLLGDMGIDLFTSDLPADLATEIIIANWWDSLSEEGKRKATELSNQPIPDGSNAGRAVKEWIRNNNSTASTTTPAGTTA